MPGVEKIAVVTGSNKGIGFAIVKGLCEKFNGSVYLTARDVARGQAAVDALNKLGHNPLFHQLDTTDQESVDRFRDYLKTKYGGIDLLVNNAGIAFKNDATEPFAVQAKETVRVNYFGTLRVCQALFPLLKQNARVVNVSSSAGHLLRIPSEELRAKFSDNQLDIPALNSLMEKFVKDAEDGQNDAEGWGNSAYIVSKVGVTALTMIQQRTFDAETPNRNVSVNAVHPGYVDTDMTSHKGSLTVEEGAKAPLFLSLDADLKGKYVWYNCSVVAWDKELNF